MKVLVEILRGVLTVLFSVFIRVKVIEPENVPKEGAVIVAANHETMLDMFMIGYKIPRLIHWMAKEELFRNRLLAKFITSLGAYPLKRGTKDTSAAKTTFDLLEKGEIVGIFPQGTRAKGRSRDELKAKHGIAKFAVDTGTKVQPVAIWGKCRLFGKVYVRFGKPYALPSPEQEQSYSREQYAELAESVMDRVYALMEVPDGNQKG